MTTELVTQIVILATACVGLYKAATLTPKARKGESRQQTSDSVAREVLDAVIGYIGMLLFMLGMPAFVWAFTAIVQGIASSTDSDRESMLAKIAVSSEPTPAETMLVAASKITYSRERHDTLKKVVEHALNSCEPLVAITAAESVADSSGKRDLLMHIVEKVGSPSFFQLCSRRPTEANTFPTTRSQRGAGQPGTALEATLIDEPADEYRQNAVRREAPEAR